MPSILLATLNARYFHASLGLRYLLANMGELQDQTRLHEFIITQRPGDIVERLLADSPRIVGFGVYIWNVEETTKVVGLLKRVAPEVTVVLGGPEVSHETAGQPIVELADYVVTGQADLAFAELCRRLLRGERPAEKIIAPEPPPLERIELPYAFYTDHDIAQRIVYVEASRGCPFKCEFCLSSLDKTAWPYELERFLDAMRVLYDRGLRHFKFVDRTFNLNVKSSLRILEFFLERLDDKLFLHFEVVPDQLPDKLKEAIVRFPKGVLQFEIGIQTFNPVVQELISRRQDDVKTERNLQWLRAHTHAHIHADLIMGLPGEDLESFATGFDRLVRLGPHEIQVGILKRLRGTPIVRHTDAFDLRYSPYPPYNVLATDRIDYATMQRLGRFARYWDMTANSGRFPRAMALMLGGAPFRHFLRFTDWLYEITGQTNQIALDRLFDLIFTSLTSVFGIDPDTAREALAQDYAESGARGAPAFMQAEGNAFAARTGSGKSASAPSRQARHARQE